ncbi:MAG: site-specific DNA-methyltransferase [Candidatus Excrementavichristensenella sp.]|jgi:adenine-specific DNA-methyltransferase
MAAIHDLIAQVENPELRARLEQEVARLNKQKKFGLVFEEHIPECTPLYDMPIRRGSHVALRAQQGIDKVYTVVAINEENALCFCEADKEQAEYALSDLVVVAQFGEPIYPYLKPLDSVCNAPDSDLWHALIEADNYHALQLLEYLYAGQVDCIYIDPPYNTGARDWKYNNDYVDGNDSYRHSKWLSMMQKRLKLAKKLLNPRDSVLIVTIDEKEYLHLGCLLEELFPEARIQMVSSVISPQGATREKQFSRTDEYIFFVAFGSCSPQSLPLGPEWSAGASTIAGSKSLIWDSLKRRGSNSLRRDRPNLFYPLFVSEDAKRIIKIGDSLPLSAKRESVEPIKGCRTIWPIRSNGDEGNWQVSQAQLKEKLRKGFVRLGRFDDADSMSISYLKRNEQKKVESGIFKIIGRREDGSIITDKATEAQNRVCGTQWRITSHNAGTYGTALLLRILGEKRFSFPKSLYAEHDTILFFVANKPNALILDFFAGSGTTLHAVNLLNAEDGGQRRCIMVTNNEVSTDEAKALSAKGYKPGDEEWDELGIARYVTWPRTVCSIEGHDVNGNPLKGNYIGSDLPMADGFKANAIFFKLGFLDKTSVSLGRQFIELLPVLWMKAGAVGPCPYLEDNELPRMLILPENRFAVLLDETAFTAFADELKQHPKVQMVYIITDYEAGFRTMADALREKKCCQLYRSYLDNFRINQGRA